MGDFKKAVLMVVESPIVSVVYFHNHVSIPSNYVAYHEPVIRHPFRYRNPSAVRSREGFDYFDCLLYTGFHIPIVVVVSFTFIDFLFQLLDEGGFRFFGNGRHGGSLSYGISPPVPIGVSEPLVSEVDWQQAPAFRPVNERKPEHLVEKQERPCGTPTLSGPVHLEDSKGAEEEGVNGERFHY